jgi:hypothetical protein
MAAAAAAGPLAAEQVQRDAASRRVRDKACGIIDSPVQVESCEQSLMAAASSSSSSSNVSAGEGVGDEAGDVVSCPVQLESCDQNVMEAAAAAAAAM